MANRNCAVHVSPVSRVCLFRGGNGLSGIGGMDLVLDGDDTHPRNTRWIYRFDDCFVEATICTTDLFET